MEEKNRVPAACSSGMVRAKAPSALVTAPVVVPLSSTLTPGSPSPPPAATRPRHGHEGFADSMRPGPDGSR
jgi:hypothetical protein